MMEKLNKIHEVENNEAMHLCENVVACYSGSCHTCFYLSSWNNQPWCEYHGGFIQDVDIEKNCYTR